MTNDIGEHLRNLTSRKGRYWLRDSREGSAIDKQTSDDLPFQSGRAQASKAKAPVHESVVISIPDVAALNAKAAGLAAGNSAASQIATLQQKAVSERRLGENTKVVAPLPKVQSAPPKPQPETIAKMAQKQAALAPVIPDVNQLASTGTSRFSELDVKELPASSPRTAQPNSTAGVSAVKPVEKTAAPKTDDAVDAARASQSKSSSGSIEKIADEILAKHPIASSSVIMFAGSQATMHADETCARVAAELASRNLGRVLLIDSDFDGRRLTKASGMSSQGGLSEIMNIALPWEKAILKSGSSKLDFMAAGSCPHKRWTPKETLREAISEIRCEYQFVCVSVGDAHTTGGALWSEMSDGAFLVVSATNSSDAVAESAVERLRENGARLSGCIVADVPAEKMVA